MSKHTNSIWLAKITLALGLRSGGKGSATADQHLQHLLRLYNALDDGWHFLQFATIPFHKNRKLAGSVDFIKDDVETAMVSLIFGAKLCFIEDINNVI